MDIAACFGPVNTMDWVTHSLLILSLLYRMVFQGQITNIGKLLNNPGSLLNK